MAEGTILSRVGDRLADFLSQDDGPAAAPAGNAHHSGALSRDEFERRASHIVRDTGCTLAGAVTFLGLEKVKEKLGDRWERLSARADDIARRAIERRLDNADAYTRHGDLQYVLLFAHLNKEHAQLKCAMIAEEITKRLLGEDISPQLLEVKAMVSQARHDTTAESAPDLAMLVARLATEGEEAPRSTADDDDWWDATAKGDPLDNVQLAYRPLWDVRRNALTTYVCTPTVIDSGGRLLVGEENIPGLSEDVSATNRLDLLMQRRVIGDLRRLMALGRKLMLCLPIHFETLASSSRRLRYLERCRTGIPSGGERFLVFEIVGTPVGMPQGRLLEITSALKPHGRAILLRVQPDHALFRPPSETGVSAVGFSHRRQGEERQDIEALQRFAAGATKAGVATYIHGLRSLSLVTAAIGAGFNFVDGDIVSSLTSTPAHAYEFAIEDLFARQVRGLPGSPSRQGR